MDLRLEEMGFVVCFPSLDSVVFVVAFEAMDAVAPRLEVHDKVNDLFAARSSVDIVT